jgi:hypothetical protein
MLVKAKSATIPKTTPKKQPRKITMRSSFMKYPKIRSFGQPEAFINPMSLTLWDIMIKTMKEISSAPTMKIKIPTNIMKRDKAIEKPAVNVPSAIKDTPNPILSLNRRRKSVEATHNVKLIIIRLV